MRTALVYFFGAAIGAALAGCGEVGGDDGDGGVFFSRDATVTMRTDSGVPPSSGILVDTVFDGDTMRISANSALKAPDGKALNGEHVRFLGIDAPEIAHPPDPADCWGPEAAEFARGLLAGKFVTLEYDETHELRDDTSSHRLLAYIRLPDGRVANEVLIEEGQARSFRAFPHKYRDRYNALESQAKSDNLGMWSCPGN